MSREAHVQFYESLGVRFPGATHLQPRSRRQIIGFFDGSFGCHCARLVAIFTKFRGAEFYSVNVIGSSMKHAADQALELRNVF
jgi:hypothetical protein